MLIRSQSRRVASHTRSSASDKQTHKLNPQICVVWVPDAPGYVANLEPGNFQVASDPELAYHLSEVDAEVLVQAVRLQMGLRASIRPYYGAQHGASGAGFKASPMVITGITSGVHKND